ncbi:ADP-ribosylation factor family-domain-containing protein [Mycena latifolia]|nr:ADP-ribosylation factor family-domain-containing protein [Mycena latifolia]
MFASAAAAADRLLPPTLLPKSFEIIMVGLDGAGKTSLLNRLHRTELPAGVLPATIPTIGSNIETVTHGRHSIKIWEFGGIEKIRPLWRRYYWNAHAFVFLLDAATPARFAEAKAELQLMLAETTERAGAYPLLVLANKTDLTGSADLSAISEALGLAVLDSARSGRAVALKGVSAMTGAGTEEALQWFVENVSHEQIVRSNGNKRNKVQAW